MKSELFSVGPPQKNGDLIDRTRDRSFEQGQDFQDLFQKSLERVPIKMISNEALGGINRKVQSDREGIQKERDKESYQEEKFEEEKRAKEKKRQQRLEIENGMPTSVTMVSNESGLEVENLSADFLADSKLNSNGDLDSQNEKASSVFVGTLGEYFQEHKQLKNDTQGALGSSHSSLANADLISEKMNQAGQLHAQFDSDLETQKNGQVTAAMPPDSELALESSGAHQLPAIGDTAVDQSLSGASLDGNEALAAKIAELNSNMNSTVNSSMSTSVSSTRGSAESNNPQGMQGSDLVQQDGSMVTDSAVSLRASEALEPKAGHTLLEQNARHVLPDQNVRQISLEQNAREIANQLNQVQASQSQINTSFAGRSFAGGGGSFDGGNSQSGRGSEDTLHLSGATQVEGASSNQSGSFAASDATGLGALQRSADAGSGLNSTPANASVDSTSQLSLADRAEIVRQVQALGAQGQRTAQLSIDSAEFGTIHLKVKLVDGSVQIELQSDKPGLKEAIDQSISDLKSSLAQHNFTVEHVRVKEPEQFTAMNMQNQANQDFSQHAGQSQGFSDRRGANESGQRHNGWDSNNRDFAAATASERTRAVPERRERAQSEMGPVALNLGRGLRSYMSADVKHVGGQSAWVA